MLTMIRNTFKVGDIGRLIYLHGDLYAKEHGYDHTFEAYVGEPLSQFAKCNNSRAKIWLVDCDGQVSGSVAICEVSLQEAQLRWFLLSPQLRGKGMGARLLKEAIVFAKTADYASISLWTVKGLDAAKALYTSYGFRLAEEVTHHVWGATHTEQKYCLDL